MGESEHNWKQKGLLQLTIILFQGSFVVRWEPSKGGTFDEKFKVLANCGLRPAANDAYNNSLFLALQDPTRFSHLFFTFSFIIPCFIGFVVSFLVYPS